MRLRGPALALRWALLCAPLWALAVLAPAAVDRLYAQALPIKRALPPLSWEGCPAPAAPAAAGAAQRDEAVRLAAEAAQALIVGDNPTALELLSAAAELDPASDQVAYRRARTLELLERTADAVAEYCRFVALTSDAAERDEVLERVTALAEPQGFSVRRDAAAAFITGVAYYDAGRRADAVAAFSAALGAAPEWADAAYNRGVAQLQLGDTAAADQSLRRYLALAPAAADFNAVLDVFGARRAAAPGSGAGTALATGLLVPGLGHFVSNRPGRGALFLGGAASFVAAGLLFTTTDVQCLAPPEQGQCPPEQVLREDTSRPLLLPGLIGAAATGIIGAIDAYRGARAAALPRAPATRRAAADETRLLVGLPALAAPPRHTDLQLVRLVF
jgi:tetratricopeptide (TPR) repeat protein